MMPKDRSELVPPVAWIFIFNGGLVATTSLAQLALMFTDRSGSLLSGFDWSPEQSRCSLSWPS
jgi:hypothetical protein